MLIFDRVTGEFTSREPAFLCSFGVIETLVAIGASIGAAAAEAGAAIAAISATTAFEVIGAVGAGLSAIGAITKNKTLSLVGLGIGAIGGIGALASSAGLFGVDASVGSLFGVAPAESTGSFLGAAASDASSAATYGASAAGGAGGGFDAAAMTAGIGGEVPVSDAVASQFSGTIDYLSGNPTTASAPNAFDQTPVGDTQFSGATTSQTVSANETDPAAALAKQTDTSTGFLNGQTGTGTDELTKTLAGTGSKLDPLQGGAPPAPPGGLGTTDLVTGKPIETGIDAVTGKVVGLPESTDKGIFGSILDFAKKNPVVALGAIQSAGSFLSGATSSLTPAQIAALNAQAAANNAAAAATTRQTAAQSMPKAVATAMPVTGAPQPLIPQMGVPLMQRPGLAPVTGVPA